MPALSELYLTWPEKGAWSIRVLFFVWGCLWGSFVNVVIYRVPRGMSVVRPASHCPGCGAPVRPFDNLPIVSWLVLRGRARCCGVRISPRYVVVEALGGALSLGAAESVARTLPPDATLGHAAAVFLAAFALAMALLAAAYIDAEHMYLPDTITLGGTVFGLATPALRGLQWADVAVGAAIGFFGVWLPFIVLYKAVRGRDGMGLGDAKLVMLAGAWFGWPGAAFALFAGAVQATLAALLILLVHGKIEEPDAVRADREELQRAAEAGDEEARQALREDPLGSPPGEGVMAARLPFGPFLCLATVEWLLAGDLIKDRIGLFL
jgi:leader peptidase (prepilin peptidase)/N-methyltransferase